MQRIFTASNERINKRVDAFVGGVYVCFVFGRVVAIINAHRGHANLFGKLKVGIAVIDKNAVMRVLFDAVAKLSIDIGTFVLFIYAEIFHGIEFSFEKVI